MKLRIVVIGMAVFLAAGVFVAVKRIDVIADERADLRDRMQRLDGELARMRGEVTLIDRAFGARLGQGPAAARVVGLDPRPEAGAAAGPAAGKVESPEEEGARLAAEQERERQYHARLDQLVLSGGEDRAGIERVNHALTAFLSAPERKAALEVRDVRCSQTLCRMQLRRLGVAGRDPGPTMELLRALGQQMPELTMQPWHDDQSIVYMAPAGHALPDPES